MKTLLLLSQRHLKPINSAQIAQNESILNDLKTYAIVYISILSNLLIKKITNEIEPITPNRIYRTT